MPCYGPDGPPNIRSDKAEAHNRFLREELDKATRAACDLASLMPDMEDAAWDHVSRETRQWWRDHKKLDRQRKRKVRS